MRYANSDSKDGTAQSDCQVNRNTKMQLRWKDAEIVQRVGEMEFILYRREGGALVEGVTQFKYLRRTMYQIEENWPKIRQNIKSAGKVWVRLGKMLQIERVDIQGVAMFYRVVVQAILFFGSESWALSAAMERMI